jgi:catechol 2,3-dioxygenase
MSTQTHTPSTTQLAQDLLPDATGMGAVTLAVRDLDKMIEFYQSGLGLTVIEQRKGTATLGRQGVPVLRLDQDGILAHAPRTSAGLYHTAFLFADQSELASAVASVARQYPRQFQGSSDHLVSEAFYFGDPEGNGVEMYIDRPRSQWHIKDNGEIDMASLALDPNHYLQQHLTEAGATAVADTPATIGHVHLKVGDIKTARDFYVDTLGFAVTNEFGTQALFVSAGGYHHHLGMNTWESQGATERTPALGLGEVSIALPSDTPDALGALDERLAARGVAREFDGNELIVFDPWKNKVRVNLA